MKSFRTNLHSLGPILAAAEPLVFRVFARGIRDRRTRAWRSAAFAATGSGSLVNANRLFRRRRGFELSGAQGANPPQ